MKTTYPVALLMLLCPFFTKAQPPGIEDNHIKVDQFGYLSTTQKICIIGKPQTGYNSNELFTILSSDYEVRIWDDNAIVSSEYQQSSVAVSIAGSVKYLTFAPEDGCGAHGNNNQNVSMTSGKSSLPASSPLNMNLKSSVPAILSENDILVFPNPVKGELHFRSSILPVRAFRVVSAAGILVKHEMLMKVYQGTLSTAGFPAGTYILWLELEGGSQSRRLFLKLC